MGCARWKGVPLKALLAKAGVKPGVVQVSFEGLEQPLLEPPFIKALDIDHARDGEVMVAYAMNSEDLPWLNGFPVRLVVPGYYGTYWMKHLARDQRARYAIRRFLDEVGLPHPRQRLRLR